VNAVDDRKKTKEELLKEEERLVHQAFWYVLFHNPNFTPTVPTRPLYRTAIYSILVGIAIAAGMFADHEYMFVGIVIIIKGIDQTAYRLRRGWHCGLKDKYLMLAGAAITYLSYRYDSRKWDDYAMFGFLGTLGIMYPLLILLELWLLKIRCRKTEDANAIDYLDSVYVLVPGGGFNCPRHFSPIFKVWRDGQEVNICDQWYVYGKCCYERNEAVTIRVHPRHNTEIYDSRRIRIYVKQKLKSWAIYNMLMIPAVSFMLLDCMDEVANYYYLLALVKIIHLIIKGKKESKISNENGGNPYDATGSKGESTGTDRNSDTDGA
jgi:hypothetical protein